MSNEAFLATGEDRYVRSMRAILADPMLANDPEKLGDIIDCDVRNADICMKFCNAMIGFYLCGVKVNPSDWRYGFIAAIEADQNITAKQLSDRVGIAELQIERFYRPAFFRTHPLIVQEM